LKCFRRKFLTNASSVRVRSCAHVCVCMQRAIAMGILELFIIPDSSMEISISPPVRNGLCEVHRQLGGFYKVRACVWCVMCAAFACFWGLEPGCKRKEV
jgi:hypothetical protein